MKKLVWFALLAACHGSTEPKSPIGTWTLVSVHGANLPFDTALITGGGPYVVAGSLQILASRYYVETEIDSSATCTCILPAATTGGTWSADGGMLSLHDTNT